MHDGELAIDTALVQRLIASQFPEWANLPIGAVPSGGTDNAIFRLGDDRAVRLPRIYWAVDQVQKEQRWLPWLAAQLPLPIPTPLAHGAPGDGYPWNWSVCSWLDGENATRERLNNLSETAIALAHFITRLQQIDAADGPAPGAHNSSRGVPLAARDTQTRQAMAELSAIPDEVFDTDQATRIWEAALETPPWQGLPVWIHGDLQSGNLLAQHGALCAVIDFGCLGIGDPACDLMVAWNLLDRGARETFRRAMNLDDATWARGRGWALSVALIALPYYRKTNPTLSEISRYAIAQTLADPD